MVEFTLGPEQFSMLNNKDTRVIEPGWFTVSVGGGQPGMEASGGEGHARVMTARLRLTGKEVAVKD